MENDKLVRSTVALTETGKSSLTLQQRSLISELDLTATNAKTALEPRLSAEFARVLADFPAEAVESAFRAWRDVSPFFPAISDIRELAALWVRRRNEEIEAERRELERRTIHVARERGELVNFTDIVKELEAQIGKIPEPPHIRRVRKMREQVTASTAPALHLTREQIEARRETEQAEIQRELHRHEGA